MFDLRGLCVDVLLLRSICVWPQRPVCRRNVTEECLCLTSEVCVSMQCYWGVSVFDFRGMCVDVMLLRSVSVWRQRPVCRRNVTDVCLCLTSEACVSTYCYWGVSVFDLRGLCVDVMLLRCGCVWPQRPVCRRNVTEEYLCLTSEACVSTHSLSWRTRTRTGGSASTNSASRWIRNYELQIKVHHVCCVGPYAII